MIHAALAALSLLLFIPMALLFTMGEMELNPLTHNMLATAHSKVEVFTILIKALMTLSSTFLNDMRWMAVVEICFSAWLVFLHLRWLPHVFDFINIIRCGSFMSIFWLAGVLVFTAYKPLIADINNPDYVVRLQGSLLSLNHSSQLLSTAFRTPMLRTARS